MKLTDQNNEYIEILKKFPKKRIPLSDEYKDIYIQHYSNNRSGSGISNFLSQYMESWMHKRVSSIKEIKFLK